MGVLLLGKVCIINGNVTITSLENSDCAVSCCTWMKTLPVHVNGAERGASGRAERNKYG